MKREEVRMLRPLRGGVGDSSRGILSAWRRPSAFFTFFFSLEAQKWLLGFFFSKWKVHLAYFQSGMDLSSSRVLESHSPWLGSKMRVFIGSSW